MIEANIKKIIKVQKTSRTKTAQELKTLSRRQTSHEKSNNKQFQGITDAISLLPTQDVITKTIQDTIKIVVNGKIDHLTELVNTVTDKTDMVGEHLRRQDEVAATQAIAIRDLSDKIDPIDGARNWLADLGKVILYLGAIAAAIAGIIGLYILFHQ